MNYTSSAVVPEVSRRHSEAKLRAPYSWVPGMSSETDPWSPTYHANDKRLKVKPQIAKRKCHKHSTSVFRTDSAALDGMVQRHLNSDTTHDYRTDHHSFSTFSNFRFVSDYRDENNFYFIKLRRSWLFQARSRTRSDMVRWCDRMRQKNLVFRFNYHLYVSSKDLSMRFHTARLSD